MREGRVGGGWDRDRDGRRGHVTVVDAFSHTSDGRGDVVWQ